MPDSIPDILESCTRVVSLADHVRINDDAISTHAARLANVDLASPQHPAELWIDGSRAECANFILLADCLNFCFWSDAPWVVSFAGTEWTRTFAMLAGLVRGIQNDRSWLEAGRWAEADSSDVARLFSGTGEIPLPEKRVEVLRETGARLLAGYQGRFVNLVEDVGGVAPAVARRLARDFPSFRDMAEYAGQPVALLKRAQICAADLAAQWSIAGHGTLEGLDDLTVFADYRLPQLFRHWGIFELSGPLTQDIEALREVPAGSVEEVELRAATVCAGDRLARALGVSAWRLDYYLWERSHDPEVRVAHHRTRTIFY